MDIFDWSYYSEFIKDIELHLGREQIRTEKNRLLIKDIVEGILTTSEDAAAAYTDGNTDDILVILEDIQNEYIKIILDINVYHNDVQKITKVAGIAWKAVEMMLSYGYRDGGMRRALKLYDLAVYCQDFHTSFAIAAFLSNHYGQVIRNHDLRRLWFRRYEVHIDQYQITKEAMNNISDLVEILGANLHQDRALEQIEDVIAQVSQHQDKAESYIYWHSYYLAKIWYWEIKGDFNELLNVSLAGYKYFKELPLNHSHAKASMAANVVHSYNLLYRYEEGLVYEALIANEEMRNEDMLILRLACAYLNLGKIAEALKLLDSITIHEDVLSKVLLYRSYCVREFLSDGRDDEKTMQTAYLILDLYCGAWTGKLERYDPEYLDNHIAKHNLHKSREGYIIQILSLLRYRNSDDSKFARTRVLIEKLETAHCSSTEAEILNFEKMVQELL